MISIPGTKHTDLKKKAKPLNSQVNKELYLVNLILDVIIRNTLMLNKLTSIDEIIESIAITQNKLDLNIESDQAIIEGICDALCIENGVLVRLSRQDTNLYKLNTKSYI